MGSMIGIMGAPGTGKSTSLRSLPPDQTVMIDCDLKGLSWRNWREQYCREKNNYFAINSPEKAIKALKWVGTDPSQIQVRYVCIDTVNNLMTSEEMRRSREKGYDKWVDMASWIWDLVELPGLLRDDLIVILVFHTQVDETEGGYVNIHIKTNGRKTERNNIDSKFNWLLMTVKQGDQYMYETTSHNSTSRTPLGAFDEDYIPSDIMTVITAMKEY